MVKKIKKVTSFQKEGENIVGKLLYSGALIVKVSANGELEYDGFCLSWYKDSWHKDNRDADFGTANDWLQKAKDNPLAKNYRLKLEFKDELLVPNFSKNEYNTPRSYNPRIYITATRKSNCEEVVTRRTATFLHLRQAEETAMNERDEALEELDEAEKSEHQFNIDRANKTFAAAALAWQKSSDALYEFSFISFDNPYPWCSL